MVHTPVGTLRVSSSQAEEFGAGNEVTVFFRPEHCQMGRTRANRINGRVVQKEYLGSHQLVEVESNGARFTLDLADRVTLATGDTISFSVFPRHCCLFLQ